MAGTWVRVGTVTVTGGSKKITGVGTSWLSNLLQKVGKGCMCVIDNVISEVDCVNSDTELYLVEAWAGATASGKSYKIQVTVTDTIPELSSRISQSLAYANGQYGNLESWATGPAANVTLTSPAGNQVTLPNLSALNSGPSGPVEFDLRSPAQLLRWRRYGTGHTIFDASKSKSPADTDINNTNPALPWSPALPTLMGWNGQQTFGVRVDNARRADSAAVTEGWSLENSTFIENNRTSLQLDYYVSNETPLLRLCILPSSGAGSREIVNIRGSYGPWVGKKTVFDISVTNREGFKISGIVTTKNLPRFIAYKQADGTTWLYMQMNPLTCIRGVVEWTQFVGVIPFIDRVPAQGTCVWDTANGGEQAIPCVWTDDTLPTVPGTWTPVITGVSDFGSVNATYFRIGNMVTIRAYISFIGKTVPVNNGKIYGIPFIPKWLGNGCYVPCAIYKGGVSENGINAYLRGTDSAITFDIVGSRAGYQFESGADYMISATYEIA